MTLSSIHTTTLRAWLLVLGPLFPGLARRVRRELAMRALDDGIRRSPMVAAMRAQAELRAEGNSVWIGLAPRDRQ